MKFDERRRLPLTVVEIGVFLNIKPGSVRQIVRRHEIAPACRQGNAKLYWMHEIAAKVGAHQRTPRKRRNVV